MEKIDPYFFKWQTGMSERLYDPMDKAEEILSRLSVPPTVLILHLPIASLSYLQQKVVWLIVQWLAFIGIIFAFFKHNQDEYRRSLVMFVGIIFANSLFWRFHINSGQVYIFYTGLLAISWLLLNQQFKHRELASGFLAGITASLRPPYILLFIFFLINRKFNFVAGGIIGLIFAVLFSWATTDIFFWQQYILAMLGMTGLVKLEDIANKLPAIDSQSINFPNVVEGFNFEKIQPLETYLFSDSSLRNLFVRLNISNKTEILVIALAFILVIFCLLSIKYSLQKLDINRLFLFSCTACIASEFFIPIGRYSYYDIQWLLPLLIIVSIADTKKLLERKLILLLIIGFILSIGYFLWFSSSWFDNSLFYSTYLITIYVVITTISLPESEKQEKQTANRG